MFLSEWREITGSTMTGRTIVNKRQKRTLRWIATHLVTKNLIKSRLHLVTRVRWWLNTPVTAGCQQNSITFNTWQFYPLFLQWQRKYYEEGIFFFFSRGAPEENTNPSCNTKKKNYDTYKTLMNFTGDRLWSNCSWQRTTRHTQHGPGWSADIRGGAVDGLILL